MGNGSNTWTIFCVRKHFVTLALKVSMLAVPFGLEHNICNRASWFVSRSWAWLPWKGGSRYYLFSSIHLTVLILMGFCCVFFCQEERENWGTGTLTGIGMRTAERKSWQVESLYKDVRSRSWKNCENKETRKWSGAWGPGICATQS